MRKPADLFSVKAQIQPEKKPLIEVDVLEESKEEEALDNPWKLILYDDDIHTFDEVINQLMKALGCSRAHAEELTYKVHNEGKAVVYRRLFRRVPQTKFRTTGNTTHYRN
jgi:ATP-dependent Clp protease adaptor protein ClpS